MVEASYILGIKIYRDRSRRMLELTQFSYIEKVLKIFKMENSKRGFLPMRDGIKLSQKQSPKTNEMRKIELILEGYSDANFHSNDDDAKSQSGCVFKLNGGVVAWKSSKRYHLLREMVSRGNVSMDRVSLVENTTDPLTELMLENAHTQHQDKMGLRTMGDWL
ncbi:hypothetical protein Sango_3016900 [Sesamum angolense]|uniref:Uncharacterized protein n=1 Tax=Sesamum angolense TaxID=2727404 RepID=A0AAE1T3L5_9LAMI|nr:hypothetical protein Sango_3016900 [Sesamum angolense]